LAGGGIPSIDSHNIVVFEGNPSMPTARIIQADDGTLILDDPDALAMVTAVERYNCRATFQEQEERIRHFARRIQERGTTKEAYVIVVLNVNDMFGGVLAEKLMPGHDWQPIRDLGQTPFARGLCLRPWLQNVMEIYDAELGAKLAAITDHPAVLVADHGVAEVFELVVHQ
jgi:hypothetical protein